MLHFIEVEMEMQHIYQPVVIAALLDADGPATLRQLAKDLLVADERAVATAASRLQRMPLLVLRNRGVVESIAPGVWRLTNRRLTYRQRSNLSAACSGRLAKFLDTRDPWDAVAEGIGSATRSAVFQAAHGACLLCHRLVELQVDHVQPQAHGGPNDHSNLQALCQQCNNAKGVVWVDYRPPNHPHRPLGRQKDMTYFYDAKGVIWTPEGLKQGTPIAET